MRLEGRVSALEQAATGLKPWHVVIQEIGQSKAEAIAAYEAENGPIRDGDNLLSVVIKP